MRKTYSRICALLSLVLTLSIASNAASAGPLRFEEAGPGGFDLPETPSVTFRLDAPGVSTIRGSTYYDASTLASDGDSFKFEVASGYRVTRLTLDVYAGSSGGASWTLFDAADDFVASLSDSSIRSEDFVSGTVLPLSDGVYSMRWYSISGGDPHEYVFSITLAAPMMIPEPSSVLLVIAAVLSAAHFRRRRRRAPVFGPA